MPAFITKLLLGSVTSTDWKAAFQRSKMIILVGLILGAIRAINNIITKCVTTPLFLGTIILILIYFPNAVQWIFAKIGLIFLNLFVAILGLILPVFLAPFGDVGHDLSMMFSDSMNGLPSDIIDFLNAVGVGELMGIILTSIFAISVVRIYRSILKSARLL